MNIFKSNFRYRITFVLFAVSALISISFALYSYHSTKTRFFEEFRSRLKNISYCGALSIEKPLLKNIIEKMNSIPKVTVDSIENSAEYGALSEQVNAIREMDPSLIRYVYIMVSTSSPSQARFIIDADTLDALDKLKKGVIIDDKVDHINAIYDMKDFPDMMLAVNKHLNLTESKISYDEDYKLWSISGFAPIFVDNTIIATLGVDISSTSLNDYFMHLRFYYAISIVLILILTFILASYLGKTIASPIITLDNAMTQFSQKNFYVRVEPTTTDEVGALFNSFNNLAHTIQEYSAELLKNSSEIASSHETITLLETRLSHIINAMPSAIIAFDQNMQITHWNKSSEQMFGIFDYDAREKELLSLLPFLKPFNEDIIDCIKTQSKVEIGTIKVMGKYVRMYAAHFYPYSFSNQAGIVLRLDDITATQRKERQEHFIRNMDLISHLAGGLTEDFNSIIGGFSSMIKLLKHKHIHKTEPSETDITAVLKEIETAGSRAEIMSGYLALFSQQHKIDENKENISDLLGEIANEFAAAEEDILVSFVPSLHPAFINGDKALLKKALMNICENSAFAVKKAGHTSNSVMISLEKGYKDENTSSEMWCVSISDNGIGMDETVLKKVLTPFFSTDRQRTGLGLPIASAIIQLHKGYIDISSEPDKGTVVQVYLPEVGTTTL